jgi:RHS repeat-associated protein
VRHFHLDHLGTPRLVTNSAANQTAYHYYYPYGEEASAFNQDTERLKFTGHERDLASTTGAGDDLDYMHARHCSPVTGRFLSVDPANDASPATPRSWNRNAYARANPVNAVDPDGKSIVVVHQNPLLDFERNAQNRESIQSALRQVPIIGKALAGAVDLAIGSFLPTSSGDLPGPESYLNPIGVASAGAFGTLRVAVKTVVEEPAVMKVADALTGRMKTGFEHLKEALARGLPGRNQHPLTGDLKGRFAADLPGSGKGRGAVRVIYSIENDRVIIHSIEDYHHRQR